mmetsp:Transcript_41747/g.87596  ORF Transcript_41747/g.87596 Transcript_41747/m.87596 type:complete len:295 (-) Transcript_41747:498-1382(-)
MHGVGRHRLPYGGGIPSRCRQPRAVVVGTMIGVVAFVVIVLRREDVGRGGVGPGTGAGRSGLGSREDGIHDLPSERLQDRRGSVNAIASAVFVVVVVVVVIFHLVPQRLGRHRLQRSVRRPACGTVGRSHHRTVGRSHEGPVRRVARRLLLQLLLPSRDHSGRRDVLLSVRRSIQELALAHDQVVVTTVAMLVMHHVPDGRGNAAVLVGSELQRGRGHLTASAASAEGAAAAAAALPVVRRNIVVLVMIGLRAVGRILGEVVPLLPQRLGLLLPLSHVQQGHGGDGECTRQTQG